MWSLLIKIDISLLILQNSFRMNLSNRIIMSSHLSIDFCINFALDLISQLLHHIFLARLFPEGPINKVILMLVPFSRSEDHVDSLILSFGQCA